MKYPIHNRVAYYLIACLDWFLKWCHLSKQPPMLMPKQILICNTAHLGDVILTTSLLPMLKQAFPEAEISILVGSWSKPIVEDHPLVNRYHLLDHWKVSRREESLIRKVLRYLTMRRRVRKEIAHYDLAIDCGLHFPNMAPLLWSAGIPVRIGFTSAGLSPFLTHAYPWNPLENRSVVEAFVALLEPLSITIDRSLLKPNLGLPAADRESYIVIHMGSGNPQKNWPEANWRALARRLAEEGKYLVFTGHGEKEHEAIERVMERLPNSENQCDKLTWKDFTTVIQKAALLITTDTCAGHIAAATDTPSVVIATGIHPEKVWKPYGVEQEALTYPMGCSPCLKGCQAMTCIRNLSVESVYTAIQGNQKKKTSLAR